MSIPGSTRTAKLQRPASGAVVLAREFVHRLINHLRRIASLLSLQSRAVATPQAAAHVITVARRVADLGRVYRRSPRVDGWAAGEARRHPHDVLPYVAERLSISPGEDVREGPGNRAPTGRFPTSPERPENEL